jgi:hypothetical protein
MARAQDIVSIATDVATYSEALLAAGMTEARIGYLASMFAYNLMIEHGLLRLRPEPLAGDEWKPQ